MAEVLKLKNVTLFAKNFSDGTWEVGFIDRSDVGVVSCWSGSDFDTFESALENILSRSFFTEGFQRQLMAYAKEVRPEFFKTAPKEARPVASVAQMAFDF